MSSPVKKYAFIHAKLRARLSKMLDREFYLSITGATGLTEALQLLKNTDYKAVVQSYEETGDLKKGEMELIKEEIRVVKDILRYLQNELYEFVEAMLLYYEIEVVKHALRLWFDRTVRGRDVQSAVGYVIRERIVHDFSPDGVINAEETAEIEAALEKTPYRETVSRRLSEVVQEGSLFQLEIELDALYYRNLFERLPALDTRDLRIAERFLSAEIDLENLNRLVRFKSFYDFSFEKSLPLLIPYGNSTVEKIAEKLTGSGTEEENREKLFAGLLDAYGISGLSSIGESEGQNGLMLLNSLMDEIIDREVRKILYGYPFTIGIILVYIVSKQQEIRKLMSILNAHYYSVSPERLRQLV